MSELSIEDEATRLSRLSLAALRSTWRSHIGEEAPAFRSRDLLLRAYLYRVQAEQLGDVRQQGNARSTEVR